MSKSKTYIVFFLLLLLACQAESSELKTSVLVDEAVDKGISFVAKKTKKWFGKSDKGRERVNKKEVDKATKQEEQNKKNGKEGKELDVSEPFSMNGEKHTMSIENGLLYMASRKDKLIKKVDATIKFINDNPDDERIAGNEEKIASRIKSLRSRAVIVSDYAKKARKEKIKGGTKRANNVFKKLVTQVAEFGNTYRFDELGKLDKLAKPYSTSRPSYEKGQVAKVWKNAVDKSIADGDGGVVKDPHTEEILTNSPKNWDMGHIKKHKYKDWHTRYMKGKITKEAFLAWYQDPDNYVPEHYSANRSRKHD